jgi:hypothetical protein
MRRRPSSRRKTHPWRTIVMKTTRFLILSTLAAATLGLSSCVVDEGYPVEGRYAYVGRPSYYVERPYYRDYYYGTRYRTYDQGRYDGYYRTGGLHGVRSDIHGARADLHRTIFH